MPPATLGFSFWKPVIDDYCTAKFISRQEMNCREVLEWAIDEQRLSPASQEEFADLEFDLVRCYRTAESRRIATEAQQTIDQIENYKQNHMRDGADTTELDAAVQKMRDIINGVSSL